MLSIIHVEEMLIFYALISTILTRLVCKRNLLSLLKIILLIGNRLVELSCLLHPRKICPLLHILSSLILLIKEHVVLLRRNLRLRLILDRHLFVCLIFLGGSLPHLSDLLIRGLERCLSSFGINSAFTAIKN